MQLDIEELSPVRKRVLITVPAPQVDSAFSKTYNRIAQRTSLPGFRRGKVPMSHLRKRFGAQATADVTEQLVGEAWGKALDDLALTPVGQPDFDAADRVQQGKDFQFTFTVEVTPDVEVKPYAELEAKLETFSASDAVVEHELEHLAEQLASWEPVEDRTVTEDGDMVVLDYAGSIDGEAFAGGTAEDAELELGSGRFIPGFEPQLVGKTVGEAFTVEVEFPADYPAEHLAGKTAQFACTIKDIKAKVIPEIGQPLADQLGEENLDAVKAQLKTRIEGRFNGAANDEAKRQLKAQIGEAYDFEVPEALVGAAVEEKKSELISEAVKGGSDFAAARAEADEKAPTLRDEVIREVRVELVLDAMAEKEAIDVEVHEVNAQIEQMVRVMGQYGARLRQAYRDPNRRAGLRRRMRQDKVLDFLLTKANVATVERDVPMHVHDDDGDHAHDHD